MLNFYILYVGVH